MFGFSDQIFILSLRVNAEHECKLVIIAPQEKSLEIVLHYQRTFQGSEEDFFEKVNSSNHTSKL